MAGGQTFSPPQPPATTPNQLPIMFAYLTSSPNTFSQSILYGIPESPLSGLSDYHFRFSTSLSLPPFLTDQPIALSLRVSSMVSPSLHCQGWPKPPPPPRCWPGSLECSLSRTLARLFHLVHTPHPVRHPPPRLSVRHVIWECTYFS